MEKISTITSSLAKWQLIWIHTSQNHLLINTLLL